MIEKLLTAIGAGDLNGVVALLHPEAVLIGDSNGKVKTARRHIVGADKITRFLLGLANLYGAHRVARGELVLVNGDLGIAIPDLPAEDGLRPVDRRVTVVELRGGRVWRIYDMCNPDKLTHLSGR